MRSVCLHLCMVCCVTAAGFVPRPTTSCFLTVGTEYQVVVAGHHYSGSSVAYVAEYVLTAGKRDVCLFLFRASAAQMQPQNTTTPYRE